MRRFWGKIEGFFGGSGFRAKTGNSFWHEESRFFASSTKATKATNATPVFERTRSAFFILYY